MTQKEEKELSDELKTLIEAMDELLRLDEEQEKWFNSSQNKEEYETELRLRQKEYRENQM